MFTINFSDEACADLAEIIRYYNSRNTVSAFVTIWKQIERTLNILQTFPSAGRRRPEVDEDTRSFPSGSFLLFYTISPNQINITRIVHGRRNLNELGVSFLLDSMAA